MKKPKEEINLAHFQVIKYLQSIPYPLAYEGKNISRSKDWIGISCPFCITPDHSYHLGINTWTKFIRCWRCGTKGTVIKLVMKLSKEDYNGASKIIERFSKRGQLISPDHQEGSIRRELRFPIGTSDELSNFHKAYLEKRRFDPVEIQRRYRIKGIGPVSDYDLANRILIPYFYGNQIVTWTARDITEDSGRTRYRSCTEGSGLINIDHILYNIQTIRDIAVIVEGPTDVWRMGESFVAMGSLVWNSQRLLQLKQCKQVFVWPDHGNREKKEWMQLASSISTVVPDVRFIELSEGDPGELDEITVRNFRREIFGRKY